MMNTRKIAQATRHHLATFSAVGTLVLSSALLVACGGGGGVGGAGTGATVTGLSVGTVSDKGSTIVNGVEYLDDNATVSGNDDSLDVTDDNGVKRALVGDDVKRGMEVEIEHGVITCPTATLTVATCDVLPQSIATKISFGDNSLVAPITDFVPGSAAGVTPATFPTFKLLGQKVVMTATTFKSFEGLVSELANGVIVEVHGNLDLTKNPVETVATRVEVKAASATGFTGALRLRGVIDLTASTIGGAKVTLTAQQRGSVTDGQVVRAKLSGSAEPYTVVSIKTNHRELEKHKGLEVELEGLIAGADTSVAGQVSFTLRGSNVKVTSSTTLVGVTLAGLTNGVRVEAEGVIDKNDSTGVIAATKVKLHTEDEAGSGGGGGGGAAGGPVISAPEEFHGRIVKPNPVAGATPAFVNSYDAATHTFGVYASNLVNGVLVTTLTATIQITADTKFVGNRGRDFSEGALSKLGTGGLVVIYGTKSADGNTIIASRIKNDTSTE